MNKTKTYYQPQIPISECGENIRWNCPKEIFSFQAFANEQDCKNFMELECGYENGEYIIMEYHDEDIEGVTILDSEGYAIEINDENSDVFCMLDKQKETVNTLLEEYKNITTPQECNEVASKMVKFLEETYC